MKFVFLLATDKPYTTVYEKILNDVVGLRKLKGC